MRLIMASFSSPATNEPPEKPTEKKTDDKSEDRSVREFEGGVSPDKVFHGKDDRAEDSKSQCGSKSHQTEESLFMVGVFGHRKKFRRCGPRRQAKHTPLFLRNCHWQM